MCNCLFSFFSLSFCPCFFPPPPPPPPSPVLLLLFLSPFLLFLLVFLLVFLLFHQHHVAPIFSLPSSRTYINTYIHTHTHSYFSSYPPFPFSFLPSFPSFSVPHHEYTTIFPFILPPPSHSHPFSSSLLPQPVVSSSYSIPSAGVLGS